VVDVVTTLDSRLDPVGAVGTNDGKTMSVGEVHIEVDSRSVLTVTGTMAHLDSGVDAGGDHLNAEHVTSSLLVVSV